MEKGLVVEESARKQEKQGETSRQEVAAPPRGREGRPDPQWVRGRCPECGDDLVSNLYYIGGKGYLLVWECWSSLGGSPACRYRKVL
jgi:hypothetical protein